MQLWHFHDDHHEKISTFLGHHGSETFPVKARDGAICGKNCSDNNVLCPTNLGPALLGSWTLEVLDENRIS
jgi:hypothetical protein